MKQGHGEERIAARLLRHAPRKTLPLFLPSAPRRRRLGKGRDVVLREWLEPHNRAGDLTTHAPDERSQFDGEFRAALEGQHERQRGPLLARPNGPECRERRSICPLRIVDQDGQRILFGDRADA